MPMVMIRKMRAKKLNRLDSESLIVPGWPAPRNVGCLSTTRLGGVSRGVFSSLNLGCHVGDDPDAVTANREVLKSMIAGKPVWLTQVHGTRVVDAGQFIDTDLSPEADAAFIRRTGGVCAVMTADCLPVLLCDDSGSVVAAVHAGWRGLLAGVLEATVKAMKVPGTQLMAWLGPAIGQNAFEVGDEVRAAFSEISLEAEMAFRAASRGKWWADIYCLARQRLISQGVERVFGGDHCTASEAELFFSYRRDGRTGRMASMIWLNETAS